MEKPVIRISVRNLVEFILRDGDLDNTKGIMDKEAMLKGGRLHRKIQRQMGSNYQAEVPLKKETEYEDLIILTEGRADGILTDPDRVVLDEIKGIYGNVSKLEAPVPVHKAQAMCYAWVYADKEKLERITVQMTYANLDTEEIRRFQETFSYEELEAWYRELLDKYHKWVSYENLWKSKRNASMEGLEFPFAYRKGQREMVSAVYHTISMGKQIFIQAPTGVGKTMSTIFPAVRALGEKKGDRIFYLTAKTITRTVAGEAFRILQEKGLKFQVITITAKEKLCILDKPACDPSSCPYAKGHYDRINEAVFELWTTSQLYGREQILAQAEKWRVCPFELCLDLAVWVDGVICDYNYVFDPNAHLRRFFGEGVSGDYIFLIDEAHNLVERGREMYSASLYRKELLEAKKLVKPFHAKLARSLEKTGRQLLELKKECGPENYKVLENPGAVTLSLLQAMGELENFLEEPGDSKVSEQILDFYFRVRDFLNIAQLVDENYVVYVAEDEDGDFYMKLFCVNPAQNLDSFLKKGRSAVFFSATLLPMSYYKKLLSVQEDDYGIYVRSPFSAQKRCILLGTDVSSRYTRRNYEEYKKIASYIAHMAWQKKGNYMVFFPSYKLLEEVRNVYQEEFSVPWVRCIAQSSSMTEREREEFLEEFRQGEASLLGFCVMGGIFSEGIDLIGERLIGVVIVGTGLPLVSREREILKRYYDEKGEDGFAYAYRYPGMNKVLQAAGRVIRTREDVGAILLLDDRFARAEYKELFPAEWMDRKCCSLGNVERHLKKFWESVKSGD
ncbi:MAG TPA: ATP-dependent DNA helicase [Candidatus Blautia faecavium]|uniref:ATP-dependent DNA helicase n=1 Tax=Candidatus Blautia faecavium TaxID=2838487 RepID=A0A9D2LU03_9FIRM|nr:ATP-dependent DNA helicase [Candidatus Blautia faecavium]